MLAYSKLLVGIIFSFMWSPSGAIHEGYNYMRPQRAIGLPNNIPPHIVQEIFKKTSQQSHPHVGLSVEELIQIRGYPVEVHRVITNDGYILTIHRIPGPRGTRNTQRNALHQNLVASDPNIRTEKRVAFLQHCNHCSAYDFILNEPERALAFIMADSGYDVWLGNFRGTHASRNHVELDPNETEFWKFNIDSLIRYDLPSMIKYVLDYTSVPQIYYVGHSLGTMTSFGLFNIFPEFNSKIRAIAAMGPVATLKYMKGPLRPLWKFISHTYRILETAGFSEVLGNEFIDSLDIENVCDRNSIFFDICESVYITSGGDNIGYINKDYLKVILGYSPAATSIRMLAHFGQQIREGKFQMFDYGASRNIKKYGSEKPPTYDLSYCRVPVGLFTADNDYISNPRDLAYLRHHLPNIVLDYKVQLEDFNHQDFMLSDFANYLVYDKLLEFFDHY